MMRTLAASMLLACAAPAALADEDSGFYLGAGVGQFNIEIEDVAGETFDGDDTSLKLFGGFRFSPYLALELDYLDLGSADDTVFGVDLEAEVDGFAPFVIATLPAGPVELFAKVGYFFYDIEITASGLGSADDSDEDLIYGAGIGLTVLERLHARLEYEVADVTDLDDANAIWLSGAWRF